MADHAFPYNLASFAVGAFATGFTVNSLKRCFTRPVKSMEKTAVDLNLLLPSQTRKRKRDLGSTPFPAIKRRVIDAINILLTTNSSMPLDDVNTPSPNDPVKVTSNAEQGSVEITIGNVSSHKAHYIQTRLHYGVKISSHARQHHSKYDHPHAAVSCRNKRGTTDARDSTAANEANEEEYNSDRTMIGDDPGHHDHESDDSKEQSEDGNRSSDRGEEDDDFENLIRQGSESETHEEEYNDSADHAVKQNGLEAHGEDDDGSEDDKQEEGGTYEQAIQIHLHH